MRGKLCAGGLAGVTHKKPVDKIRLLDVIYVGNYSGGRIR